MHKHETLLQVDIRVAWYNNSRSQELHKTDAFKFSQISQENTCVRASEVALKLLNKYYPNNLSVGLLKLQLFWEIYNARLGQYRKISFLKKIINSETMHESVKYTFSKYWRQRIDIKVIMSAVFLVTYAKTRSTCKAS